MPRPGFYNDNAYRAYPFIEYSGETLPYGLIVDAGFIAGLDCGFDSETHTIWIDTVVVTAAAVEITFRTDANDAPLVFSFLRAVDEWTTIYSESESAADNECADEPIWSGFIVVGEVDKIVTTLAATTTFGQNFVIEPGRIQNLAKSYVRSINVGNYARLVVPPCDDAAESEVIDLENREIVINATCLKNKIRLKEGYNCRITQSDFVSTIFVTAARGAGQSFDEELCENHGEIPLDQNESKPAGSLFYSGGPACKDLIFTINGVSGKNVNIVGGSNIAVGVGAAPNSIKISLNSNLQGGCNE